MCARFLWMRRLRLLAGARAERATEALLDLIPRVARVVHGGEEIEVLVATLVTGDILVLAEGDRIEREVVFLGSVGLDDPP